MVFALASDMDLNLPAEWNELDQVTRDPGIAVLEDYRSNGQSRLPCPLAGRATQGTQHGSPRHNVRARLRPRRLRWWKYRVSEPPRVLRRLGESSAHATRTDSPPYGETRFKAVTKGAVRSRYNGHVAPTANKVGITTRRRGAGTDDHQRERGAAPSVLTPRSVAFPPASPASATAPRPECACDADPAAPRAPSARAA